MAFFMRVVGLRPHLIMCLASPNPQSLVQNVKISFHIPVMQHTPGTRRVFVNQNGGFLNAALPRGKSCDCDNKTRY